jgi:DNA-binding MarR family transcriptional regulator
MSDSTKIKDPRKPALQSEASGSDLDDFLCFAVYEANLAFNHLYRTLLDEIGLTYPQYLVMTLLWRQDERTVKEIGEALSLEYNTLTPLIKRLEAMGFVSRVRDVTDQRVVKVTLTRQGKAFRDRARDIPKCVAEASGLADKAFGDLKTALNQLRSNLLSDGEKQ